MASANHGMPQMAIRRGLMLDNATNLKSLLNNPDLLETRAYMAGE